MADREELHELHVDELGAGAQRQRIAVAAHIGRRAVAPIKPREAAGGDDDRLGRDRDRRAVAHREARPRRHATPSITTRSVMHDIADAADARLALHLAAQACATPPARSTENRHRRSAAGRGPAPAPGGCGRPHAAPSRHARHPSGGSPSGPCSHSSRASRSSHRPRPARERVGEMMAPMIRHLLAQRDRDRHLRHDRGAAAADQAAIDQQHVGVRLVGRDRRRHAGGARADHQHVRRKRSFLTRVSIASHARPEYTEIRAA